MPISYILYASLHLPGYIQVHCGRSRRCTQDEGSRQGIYLVILLFFLLGCSPHLNIENHQQPCSLRRTPAHLRLDSSYFISPPRRALSAVPFRRIIDYQQTPYYTFLGSVRFIGQFVAGGRKIQEASYNGYCCVVHTVRVYNIPGNMYPPYHLRIFSYCCTAEYRVPLRNYTDTTAQRNDQCSSAAV